MNTKKKLKDLKAILARIGKCSGECVKCPNLAFATGSDGLNAYFAVGCALAPDFCPIADSPKKIKSALMEQLIFEIEVLEDGLRHESRHKADKGTAGPV